MAISTLDKKVWQAEESKRYRDRKKADTADHGTQSRAHEYSISDKEVQQKQIADQSRDVESDKAAVKNLSEMVAQERESLPAFDKVADLEGQLEAARTELKQQEASSRELNDMRDNLAVKRQELKNARQILSSLLVAYMAAYRQQSIKKE